MEIDEIIAKASWALLLVCSAFLLWCGVTVAIKSRKEKKWLETYVPTLGRNLDARKISSWLTLGEVERRRKSEKKPRKGKQRRGK